MQKYALIIGGTKGLGRELAIETLARGITPWVTGRSVDDAMKDPALHGGLFARLDLAEAATSDALRKYRFLGHLEHAPIFTHVFWVAGLFLHKPLTDCTQEEIAAMTAVHFTGPVAVLAAVHRVQKASRPLADPPGAPYHLVTIGSTSSWRVREDETVYCALKAAKAHFTRNFARELFRDLPGSKATLVNPGGIATPNFWQGTGRAISAYMDPRTLAARIWSLVDAQQQPFAEYQVLRGPAGEPVVSDGAATPEAPTL